MYMPIVNSLSGHNIVMSLKYMHYVDTFYFGQVSGKIYFSQQNLHLSWASMGQEKSPIFCQLSPMNIDGVSKLSVYVDIPI